MYIYTFLTEYILFTYFLKSYLSSLIWRIIVRLFTTHMWNFVFICIFGTHVNIKCCLQLLGPTNLDKLGTVFDSRVYARLNDCRFHSQNTAAGRRAFKGRHLVSPCTDFYVSSNKRFMLQYRFHKKNCFWYTSKYSVN